MPVAFNRRRFITLAAVAVGLPMLFKTSWGGPRLARWEGISLGAPATILLYHNDEGAAHGAINAALTELRRLESVFSLQMPHSAISTLNREGALFNAPPDLLDMVERALFLAKISNGIYDPTVQPLWNLYYRHFKATHPDPLGPSPRDRAAALALVDWRAVETDRTNRKIVLTRKGMALTLNGGAQGYITDRIANLLRSRGFDRMLVDMGEPLALSTKPDGSAWRIAIANPADTSKAVSYLEVVDKCVATSGGYGTIFDEAGRFTHLFDTRTGLTAPALTGVSVIAGSGMTADGLSAAMLLAPKDRRKTILGAGGGEEAIFVTPEGVMDRVVA